MFQDIHNMQNNFRNEQMKYWISHNLFHGKWWLILLLNLIFILILVFLIDRNRTLLISFTFLFSFSLIGLINELGNYFGFWDYPYQLFAFSQRFNAVDFATVPVIMTLTYQFFSNWKAYLIADLILSMMIGLVGVPIFIHFHYYTVYNWNPFFSFILLFITFLLIKLFIDPFSNKKNNKRYA